jgi:hypothetical protein
MQQTDTVLVILNSDTDRFYTMNNTKKRRIEFAVRTATEIKILPVIVCI